MKLKAVMIPCIVRVLVGTLHFHICLKKIDITFSSALQLGLCALEGDLDLANKWDKEHEVSVLRGLACFSELL